MRGIGGSHGTCLSALIRTTAFQNGPTNLYFHHRASVQGDLYSFSAWWFFWCMRFGELRSSSRVKMVAADPERGLALRSAQVQMDGFPRCLPLWAL